MLAKWLWMKKRRPAAIGHKGDKTIPVQPWVMKQPSITGHFISVPDTPQKVMGVKNHHGPAIANLTGNHVTRISSPGCNILARALRLIGPEVSRCNLQMLTLDTVAQIFDGMLKNCLDCSHFTTFCHLRTIKEGKSWHIFILCSGLLQETITSARHHSSARCHAKTFAMKFTVQPFWQKHWRKHLQNKTPNWIKTMEPRWVLLFSSCIRARKAYRPGTFAFKIIPWLWGSLHTHQRNLSKFEWVYTVHDNAFSAGKAFVTQKSNCLAKFLELMWRSWRKSAGCAWSLSKSMAIVQAFPKTRTWSFEKIKCNFAQWFARGSPMLQTRDRTDTWLEKLGDFDGLGGFLEGFS